MFRRFCHLRLPWQLRDALFDQAQEECSGVFAIFGCPGSDEMPNSLQGRMAKARAISIGGIYTGVTSHPITLIEIP